MAKKNRQDDQSDFEIDALERELSFLAYQWRKLKSQGYSEKASSIVQEYHAKFARLWELGWDGQGLLPDQELPDELMPEYYLARWGKG